MATTITANGINFPDGSAGSPSIGGSDTNTGLFTGSDIVGFATGGNERLKIDASGNINIANDSGKLQLGASNDLQIFHDGSGSFISDTGTGSLAISGSVVNINNSDNSEFQIKAVENAQVELYHNGSKKFETYTYGVNISGTAKIESGGNFHAHDNVKFIAGTGEDLQIYHDGSNSYLDNATGNFEIRSNEFRVKSLTSTEPMIHATKDGTVRLYYDNEIRVQTEAWGTRLLGPSNADLLLQIQASASRTAELRLIGNNGGNGNPDYSRITKEGSGGSVHFQNLASGSWANNLVLVNNGATELYYSGTKKFETRSDGNKSTGVFYSDGDLRPWGNNNSDLGSSSNRWRNIYTNDLHLSNVGHTNDVDGSWGDWTIQEGESDLFLKNNRSGKKYKFNLTEVS